MIKKILIECFVLILPAAVFALQRKFPGNKITPYLTPKILADRKYPKAELRRAGLGCCVLSAWLFALLFITTDFFLPAVERLPALQALLFLALPITSVSCLIIGLSYLARGIFGRGDKVEPGLESMNAARKECLPEYIRKIKIYNAVNLACPLLLAVFIPAEVSLGIAESGRAVLFNVSLLITFILTLWRIRVYLVKAATVMDLSANKILRSTLSSPLGIFFVWFHSVTLVRKFKRQNSGESA
ncbi:MAG TPA: hypothetical protein PKL97_09380 [Candidatus Omnitrophota bacterium]|nr:hypothetical protein [Candidatus Omnitrophota bacterium]